MLGTTHYFEVISIGLHHALHYIMPPVIVNDGKNKQLDIVEVVLHDIKNENVLRGKRLFAIFDLFSMYFYAIFHILVEITKKDCPTICYCQINEVKIFIY